MISQSFEAFAVVWERLRLQAQPVSPTVPGRLKLSICQKRVRGLREYLEGGNVSHHSPEAHVQELEQANRPSSCLDLATSRVQMLLPATVPHPVLPFSFSSTPKEVTLHRAEEIVKSKGTLSKSLHLRPCGISRSLGFRPNPRVSKSRERAQDQTKARVTSDADQWFDDL